MSDIMPTVCHFCGSKVTILSDGRECKADDGSWIGFQCGTSWHKGYHNPRQLQSRPCEIDERDALKARIQRLEAALRRIANQDYRGNRSTESQIAAEALKEDKP